MSLLYAAYAELFGFSVGVGAGVCTGIGETLPDEFALSDECESGLLLICTLLRMFSIPSAKPREYYNEKINAAIASRAIIAYAMPVR